MKNSLNHDRHRMFLTGAFPIAKSVKLIFVNKKISIYRNFLNISINTNHFSTVIKYTIKLLKYYYYLIHLTLDSLLQISLLIFGICRMIIKIEPTVAVIANSHPKLM